MHHLPTLLAHSWIGFPSSGFILFLAIVAIALFLFAATNERKP